MQEKQNVLEVRHLSISFTQYARGMQRRELHAVRDLDLTIHAGEVLAVVGSSGSGKSLLASGILGLLPYNATMTGEVCYLGEQLTDQRRKKLLGHEIVLVPQSVGCLDPLMKVGEQVHHSSRDQKQKTRAREALARYGLAPEVDEMYPFELSGGMARRVLIATAAMEQPRLVIADEPTPGLHLRAAKRILSHFREIADSGAAVLLITHDLELALTVADRVAVFYAGMTLEEAAAGDFEQEELLRHPYSRALWRAMPSHGFVSTAGVQPYVQDMPKGCPFGPRCEHYTEQCSAEIPLRQLRNGRVRCIRAE